MNTRLPYRGAMMAMSAVLAACSSGHHNTAGTVPVATYTIAGTVSGLQGTGLVLSNNGVSIGIGSDGNFAFADALDAGTAYDVTVATQPSSPAQVCTVANGSGVANANVTNVAVTCTTTTYTISGTVSGLTGTGLELSNNGVNLAVSADGNFTFADPVNAGATYAVAVATQPASPAQVCSVANATGTATANVSDVAVTCATTPMSITGSTPAAAATDVARNAAPTVTFSAALDDATLAGHVTFKRGTHTVPAAITSSGDTITVTPQAPLSLLTTYTVAADSGLLGLYGEPTAANSSVSFTTVDGVWHGGEVAKPNTLNPSDLRVAVMPNGTAVATWYEYNGPHTDPWANIYTPGTGWGTPAQLQVTNSHDEVNTRVAVDANGHAVVVWSENDGVRSDIWYVRYTTGTGWSSPTQLSPSNVGVANDAPVVAMNANGDAVFAWVNHINADYAVWARVLSAAGTLGAATRIESATGNTSDVRVVMGPSGNAAAVWSNYDTGNGTLDLWANSYSNGSWGAGGIIENSTDPISEYSATVDSNGVYIATWSQQLTNSSQGVYTSHSATGATWDAATLVATTTNSASYYPQSSVDADGNELVIWGQYDGSTLNVYSRYRPAGSAYGTPVVTGMNTTGKVIFDGSGNALAVWTAEVTLTNRVIQASRFTVAGGWSAPTVITPGPGTNAQDGQFGVDAIGGAVAVWISYDSNANTSAIVGSRFDDSPLIQ